MRLARAGTCQVLSCLLDSASVAVILVPSRSPKSVHRRSSLLARGESICQPNARWWQSMIPRRRARCRSCAADVDRASIMIAYTCCRWLSGPTPASSATALGIDSVPLSGAALLLLLTAVCPHCLRTRAAVLGAGCVGMNLPVGLR